tara:strand:- start:347 stop:775 length:429 start_codon:yes stop_codon:yes gene_type:complete
MKNDLSKLFDELKHSIERIGIERTIFQLNKTNDDGNVDVYEFIVISLCGELHLTKSFIFHKTRKHSQKRKESLFLLSYLLYNYNSNTQKEIGDLIGKDAPTINRYIKHVRDLNDKIPHENRLKIVLTSIENKIKELKNKPNG